MKLKVTTLLFLAVTLCCFSVVAHALPVQLIENGGFETGTLDGWDYHINTQVQNTNTYSGQYAAGLSISQARFLSTCGWTLYLDSNPCSAFLAQELNGFSTTDKKLSLSFAYNVEVLKELSPDNDKLFVGLVGWGGELYAHLSLGTNTYTNGWATFSENVDLSSYDIDTAVLVFFFADGPWIGSCDISSAFIDDVSVTANPVPEPGTILLVGFGLLTLGLVRRKDKT